MNILSSIALLALMRSIGVTDSSNLMIRQVQDSVYVIRTECAPACISVVEVYQVKGTNMNDWKKVRAIHPPKDYIFPSAQFVSENDATILWTENYEPLKEDI